MQTTARPFDLTALAIALLGLAIFVGGPAVGIACARANGWL